MMLQLVTISTFPTPIEANIAKNRLENEGVPSFVNDEATVGIAWHLGNALGGIKVQVAEKDAERARSILADGQRPEITREDRGADDQDRQANVDDGADREYVKDGWAGNDGAEDQWVDRGPDVGEASNLAFRVSMLGLLFPPLQLYSLWLLGGVFLGSQPLSPSQKKRCLLTLFIDLPVICLGAWAGLLVTSWAMYGSLE